MAGEAAGAVASRGRRRRGGGRRRAAVVSTAGRGTEKADHDEREGDDDAGFHLSSYVMCNGAQLACERLPAASVDVTQKRSFPRAVLRQGRK